MGGQCGMYQYDDDIDWMFSFCDHMVKLNLRYNNIDLQSQLYYIDILTI